MIRRIRMRMSMRSKVTGGICALALLVLSSGLVLSGGLGSTVAVAAGNANFVGVWSSPDGNWTILTQDAGGTCGGTSSFAFPMSDCHVDGSAYTFTLTSGSYVSVNKGTISGDTVLGEFTDTFGHDIEYQATRASAGPTVTNLNQRSGPITGGTSVVVTGTGFGKQGDADTAKFVPVGNGTPIAAVNVSVISDTEIDLTTPNVSAVMPTGGALHTSIQVTDINNNSSTIGDAGNFNFPVTIVEIGDSIASGEGTLYGYNYDPTTELWNGGNPNATWAGGHQLCHDSQYAYGQVLSDALGANFVQLACTGATYANGITTPEVSGGTTYQPAQFGGTAYDDAQPDAVVMTFGADDVKFVDIVEECIKSALAGNLAATECLPSNPGSTVQADFFNELPALTASYGAMAAAIEARGNAASPKRVPKIIFTDYMDPFPSSGGCPDTWPMTDAQISYLNTLMGDLNSAIRTAITGLSATDPNVGFADVSGALIGHTWCTPDPWDYGLSIVTQGGQVSNIFSTSPNSLAPFHPTPAGQAAIANLVRPVVASMLNIPAGVTLTIATNSGSGSPNSVTAQPGDSVTADATGYNADETVDATVHSTPVSVGSAVADSHGNVAITVTIPVDTPAGPHELRLTGQRSGLTTTLPLLVLPSTSAPVFSNNSPPLTTTPGSVYTASFGAPGIPSPTYSLAAGAPAWLSITPPFTGIVTGTPPAGTTTFTYSVTASNGIAPAATAGPFTVSVTTTTTPPPTRKPPTGVPVGSTSTTPTVNRIAGTDRIATAIAASRGSFPLAGSAKAVVLASANGFADGLAGVPLAAAKDAPMLLTETSTLDAATQAEIVRVLPAGGTVYLLGGSASLAPSVATALTGAGFTVVRYGGLDRFDTATIIADKGLGNPSTLLLANGMDFPDGLTAGPAAASVHGAILLTDGTTLGASTTSYLSTHPDDTVYAVGGAAATADPSAKQLVGVDRYATAALVATTFFPHATTAGVSTGESFPDALTGGAYLAELGAPMLLTTSSPLATAVTGYLHADSAIGQIVVFGGSDAVSDSSLSQL